MTAERRRAVAAWAACTLWLGACHAPWTPLQLGLVGGAQWFDEATPLRGVAAGLAVQNQDTRGVQLGVFAGSERGAGLALAPFAIHYGAWAGVRCGGWVGCRECDGVMLGLVTFPELMVGPEGPSGVMHGAALGLLNGGDRVAGVQLGGVNAAVDVRGVQAGLGNHTRELCGVQVGLVNVAQGRGLQLGLLNIKADGFLPVFPLINF